MFRFMKSIIFSFLFMFSSTAFGQLQNEISPFTTDGCSVVPDLNFTDCCVFHDIAYWKGGTKEQRKAADEDLAACVAKKSNKLIGSMFYWGVKLGGGPNLLTSFRWGYGWKHNMGYRALTHEELQAVKAIQPKDALATPITDPTSNLKQYPVVHGNYCLDEIFTYLVEIYGKDSLVKIESTYKVSDNFDTNIRVQMSDKKTYRFRIWNKKWEACSRPIYDEVLPSFIDEVFQY